MIYDWKQFQINEQYVGNSPWIIRLTLRNPSESLSRDFYEFVELGTMLEKSDDFLAGIKQIIIY